MQHSCNTESEMIIWLRSQSDDFPINRRTFFSSFFVVKRNIIPGGCIGNQERDPDSSLSFFIKHIKHSLQSSASNGCEHSSVDVKYICI